MGRKGWLHEMVTSKLDIQSTLRRVIDAVLPPRCLMCGAMVADPGALCSTCFEKVEFIAPPLCYSCGLPFRAPFAGDSEDLICGACAKSPPRFARARAVFLYTENSRSLITRLKHSDRTDYAPALSGWMVRAGKDILEAADLLVPVPLHNWRLMWRTYNQSALLTRNIQKLTGVPARYDILKRVKATPSQGRLSAGARRRNVSGAFSVRLPDVIANRRVVIVDDVLTTGATLNACARVLLESGAKQVDALVAGRVPAPRS